MIIESIQPLDKLFDVRLITPKKFTDARGFFLEMYNHSDIDFPIAQINRSESCSGCVRGLHFQLAPYAQSKIVTVTSGSILDVMVDLRKDSLTFGKWDSVILSSHTGQLLHIPAGFAHGFYSLDDNTNMVYFCDNVYHKASEYGLMWNDPDLNINWNPWGGDQRLPVYPNVSVKDQQNMSWKEFVNSDLLNQVI